MRPVLFICALLLLAYPEASRAVSVTTWHNNNSRNGTNYEETILNTSNVNSSTFGKLYSLPVDGQIYGQPLYVPSVNVTGKGLHNVLYVTTENNSVYAFDADSSGQQPLWQINLGTTVPSGRAIIPQIGITSTPVIDISRQVMYVVSETYPSSVAAFYLHCIAIRTGKETTGSPVAITGQVPGTGDGSVNGVLAFNPIQNLQRPALLELNGNIYIGFGSHGDQAPYHGWMFTYDGVTLQQLAIKCFSPNGFGGAIWQSGAGPAADSAGNIYVATGNGDFAPVDHDYGDSVLKLDPTTLAVNDYFSPKAELYFEEYDLDLGAGGINLIPGLTAGASPSVLVGSKDNHWYLLNSADLGGIDDDDDNVQQEWNTSPYHFGGPVYYGNLLYTWGSNDVMRTFAYNGKYFVARQTGSYVPYNDIKNSPSMSASANGTTPNTAILWAVHSQSKTDGRPYPGTLHAYDAVTGLELWNSTQRGTLDAAGSWSKFCPPTIANGKVYLATFDGVVNVFGLLPQ